MKPEDVRKLFYERFLSENNSILPEQSSHIITSNSVNLSDNKIVGSANLNDIVSLPSPVKTKTHQYHAKWNESQDKIRSSSLLSKGLSKTGAEKVAKGQPLSHINDFASFTSATELMKMEEVISTLPFEASDVIRDMASSFAESTESVSEDSNAS